MLIAGGGIAGIEAALALGDLAGDRFEGGLCDPRSELAFRPASGLSTGGHVEMSSIGERPRWPPQGGKAIGRYLTSFVDSLADDGSQAAPVGSPPTP